MKKIKNTLQNFKNKFNNKQSKYGSKQLTNFDANNCFEIKNLNLWYNFRAKQGLKNINLKIPKNKVTSLIGPSGCGKSTLLRCLNRMNDDIAGIDVEGGIYLDGQNIYDKSLPLEVLRMRVGMVFQKPTPFDISIKENVAYGLKAHGIKKQDYINKTVEKSLKRVALWNEVYTNLNNSGTSLSGGQQQRLCIARTIALSPEILLMDEPTSALDPIAVSKIEELITELAERYTIILVSHSMSQVQRVSDYTVFMENGVIIEQGPTRKIFTAPTHEKTKKYITGEF